MTNLIEWRSNSYNTRTFVSRTLKHRSRRRCIAKGRREATPDVRTWARTVLLPSYHVPSSLISIAIFLNDQKRCDGDHGLVPTEYPISVFHFVKQTISLTIRIHEYFQTNRIHIKSAAAGDPRRGCVLVILYYRQALIDSTNDGLAIWTRVPF